MLRISWRRGEVWETSNKGGRIPGRSRKPRLPGDRKAYIHITVHFGCKYYLYLFFFLISFQGTVPAWPRKGQNLQNSPLFVYRNWTLQLTTENWAWSKPLQNMTQFRLPHLFSYLHYCLSTFYCCYNRFISLWYDSHILIVAEVISIKLLLWATSRWNLVVKGPKK